MKPLIANSSLPFGELMCDSASGSDKNVTFFKPSIRYEIKRWRGNVV